MTAYITSYNGTDLNSTCGLLTPGVSGVHGVPDRRLNVQFLPGSYTPQVDVHEFDVRTIMFRASIGASSHATLITNLASLKGYLFPDSDFHPLIVSDRSSQQIMALCKGFDVNVDSLPAGVLAMQFDIPFLCYPYWEDTSTQSTHITSSPTAVSNAGQMACYPTYTCELNADMGSGLWFQVVDSNHRFTYTGALVNGDSLVVTTDQALPDVKKNGTRAWAGVSAASVFPSLAVGSNSISLSDAASFHLTVAYKRRYW